MKIRMIQQPVHGTRLGDLLREQLGREEDSWEVFRAAVAFVKVSGVQYIIENLREFARRGGRIKISVGVDQRGTSREGLDALLASIAPYGGELWAFRNESSMLPTFHPKVYLFKKADEALVIVGSGNLTSGGLFTNYEAFLAISLSVEHETDRALLTELEHALDYWCEPAFGLAVQLTPEIIEELHKRDIVPDESRSRSVERQESRESISGEEKEREPIFGKASITRPPYIPRTRRAQKPSSEEMEAGTTRSDVGEVAQGFAMTLQRTDVGVGQTTKGTSRRSPEIFIPLAARDENPEFWGWPELFTEDPEKPGKFDRRAVPMRVKGTMEHVNMMTWR
jgi:HKD family nuclease